VLQTSALLSIPGLGAPHNSPGSATQFPPGCSTLETLYDDGEPKAARQMTDHSNSSRLPRSEENIPEELAREVRKLAHDLSNALEIIVQTSYLLSTVELKEPASDWLRMLDSGVQKALDINQSLRSYIKDHSTE
jgi:hypothetical protein